MLDCVACRLRPRECVGPGNPPNRSASHTDTKNMDSACRVANATTGNDCSNTLTVVQPEARTIQLGVRRFCLVPDQGTAFHDASNLANDYRLTESSLQSFNLCLTWFHSPAEKDLHDLRSINPQVILGPFFRTT
jgi:hypothetical protein